MNCGYALLTQSGETLPLSTRGDKLQQFQLQMYHYAALGIKFQGSLAGKKVLDLCCGRGGGVAFLAKQYEAAEAVGIDFSAHQINTAQDLFTNGLEKETEDNQASSSPQSSIQFLQGDAEKLHQVEELNGKRFDLVMCIEGMHCLGNPTAMIDYVQKHLLADNGQIVIVDSFDKCDIERIEANFQKDKKLIIQKKEVITFNVKHAMQLDKTRAEKLIQRITGNKVVTRILRNFLASGEESKTYDELGKTHEYICYVLMKKSAVDLRKTSSSLYQGQQEQQTQGSNSYFGFSAGHHQPFNIRNQSNSFSSNYGASANLVNSQTAQTY
ncbi:hypothetical protein FGO68_gene5157 [Halteria grandinella]|uniref:Methyltransferase domain-containing protein n=1 Tax=Halteria grandinella TaxID=5974 RepID=A0A8J8NWJ7_HALGN|nr:hypothetical protein FGO68_gene5157 [Halteria grandinella]